MSYLVVINIEYYVFTIIINKWYKMVKLMDSKIQVNQPLPSFDDDMVLTMYGFGQAIAKVS